MSNIEISVIIPVYNSEKYLEDCLNSIFSQSFSDFEIISVNDGSTDNSGKILDEYEQKDARLRVFHKENNGPGSARNYALKQAKGKYVLFLDSDDWLEQDTLELLYNTALVNNSELVLFNSIEHYKNNITNTRKYHIIKDDEDFSNFSFDYNNNINLVMNGYHIVCTKLHKLEFIHENNLEFANKKQFEDVMFHIKSMLYAKRISYNPKILYHYRRTKLESRQTKAIKGEKSLEFFNIFQETKDFLLEEELYEKFKINYYKFVINESMNIEKNIENKYKQQFFAKMKNSFNNLKIESNDLKRLPLEYQYFYKNVIISEDNSQFAKKQKNNKKKIKMHENIIKTKQIIKKIIKN